MPECDRIVGITRTCRHSRYRPLEATQLRRLGADTSAQVGETLSAIVRQTHDLENVANLNVLEISFVERDVEERLRLAVELSTTAAAVEARDDRLPREVP